MEFNTHVMQALSAQEQVRKRRNMTWQFVQEDVLARIQNGTWPAGELIPTETELAAEYAAAGVQVGGNAATPASDYVAAAAATPPAASNE